MISLADLVTVSPVGSAAMVSNQQPTNRRDPLRGSHDRDHLTAYQEFWCPPAGTQLSVSKDFSMSASRRWCPLAAPFHPYPRGVPAGDLFSVALSRGFPRGCHLTTTLPCGARMFLGHPQGG